jgi:hypothetical protein
MDFDMGLRKRVRGEREEEGEGERELSRDYIIGKLL